MNVSCERSAWVCKTNGCIWCARLRCWIDEHLFWFTQEVVDIVKLRVLYLRLNTRVPIGVVLHGNNALYTFAEVQRGASGAVFKDVHVGAKYRFQPITRRECNPRLTIA